MATWTKPPLAQPHPPPSPWTNPPPYLYPLFCLIQHLICLMTVMYGSATQSVGGVTLQVRDENSENSKQ